MTEKFQVTRRTILAGAAFAGALAPIIKTSEARAEGGEIKTNVKATAAQIAALPRQKIELVRPPFVHAHTQKAEGGPKVVEFTMTIEEKKIIVDDEGTEVHAMTFNRFRPRSADGRPPGRLCRANADQLPTPILLQS